MKTLLKRGLRRLGIDVRRVTSVRNDIPSVRRDSLSGLLGQARSLGFSPGTVIDVGAANGTFSVQCHEIFPAAQYLLIEPLEEFQLPLKNILRMIPQARHELAAASSTEGTTCLNVHPDYVGSSLYQEAEEGTNVNGMPREVRTTTVDSLVAKHRAQPPYLMKIDVQGAELDVLNGAKNVLKKAEYVLLEISLFEFFKGGPVFFDVVAYMKEQGFVPYDLYEMQYRPLDAALSQIDMAFVKEHGCFRACHAYATPEQRVEQNRRFRTYFTKLFQG